MPPCANESHGSLCRFGLKETMTDCHQRTFLLKPCMRVHRKTQDACLRRRRFLASPTITLRCDH